MVRYVNCSNLGDAMTIAHQIYDASRGIMDGKLDPKSAEEIKKRLVDSLFVAYGARNAEPIRIAKATLLPSSGKLNSRVYFSDARASVDVATFINGSMTRYLDYNDTYLSKEALHPSDNIPPLLCYADAMGIDGATLVRAIGVAYQTVCSLADAVSIRDRGWDHVTYDSISAAAGLAALLGLPENKFVHTINLALNNNISMRQTRAGELSMWKGCTAANAARNSVFAAMLASSGMTGPAPIFEGEMGFFKQVSGDFGLDIGPDRIQKTMIKNYPVEYHAMSSVEAALSIRGRLRGEILGIDVETFSVANKIIIKDPEKRRPKTRETADHSMPYIIAYTLLNGAPAPTSYDERYMTDKDILGLIDKMSFIVTERFDAMYPEYLPIKITAHTKGGDVSDEVEVPKGHFKKPYTWDDLRDKGMRIIGSAEAVDSILDLGRRIDKASASEMFEVISNVDT